MVLLLELLLVKYLYGKYAVLICSPGGYISVSVQVIRDWMPGNAHVEDLIPIRVQCLLYHGGGLGLLATDGCNSKRIRKPCGRGVHQHRFGPGGGDGMLTEDISLV